MSRLIVRKDLSFIYESVAFEMAITASTNLFGNKKKRSCAFFFMEGTRLLILCGCFPLEQYNFPKYLELEDLLNTETS